MLYCRHTLFAYTVFWIANKYTIHDCRTDVTPDSCYMLDGQLLPAHLTHYLPRPLNRTVVISQIIIFEVAQKLIIKI
jgi:hypothetical protein